MKKRPILFSAPMVRAILNGTKTQTRRVVKPQPRRVDGGVPFGDGPAWACAEPGSALIRCIYGMRGDRLWVRECYAQDDEDNALIYRADVGLGGDADVWELNRLEGAPRFRWRPSIHMPRWASRITLEITGVRVERLHDISEADAMAEGCAPAFEDLNGIVGAKPFYRYGFGRLWESINGPGSWDANPFVWVVEFKLVTP